MRTLLVVFVLLFAVREAAAQKLVVWGVGYVSCGEYVEARNLPDHPAGRYDATFTQWVLGFATAYNLANQNSSDLFQQTDVPRAMLWLENYCKEHLSEAFFNAVVELQDELNWKHTRNWTPVRADY